MMDVLEQVRRIVVAKVTVSLLAAELDSATPLS